MVLLVRTDLKMGAGKVAVQCSHASLGAFKRASSTHPERVRLWTKSGQRKVALGVDSEVALRKLQIDAGGAALPFFVCMDAGLTEVKGNTKTVLAIGPAPAVEVDRLCSGLKLYR